jgi:GNAT superfamily N-acetyltransferase
MWEAGDIEWWWAGGEGHGFRTSLWTEPDGRDIAYLMLAQTEAGSSPGGRIDADCGWLSSADAADRAEVLSAIEARLASLPATAEAPVVVIADERDADLCARLEAAGFRRDPAEDMTQMRYVPGAAVPASLPPGFRFDDDRTRPPTTPHHLARRNGARVAERLRGGTLYRPDLDLCIRAEDGDVAAYCLCWLDTRNGVGLFEPVRTEDAYQRRGLGRALMAEGIRRLEAGGARTINVTRLTGSAAAAALYRGSGFADAFQKWHYERTT